MLSMLYDLGRLGGAGGEAGAGLLVARSELWFIFDADDDAEESTDELTVVMKNILSSVVV